MDGINGPVYLGGSVTTTHDAEVIERMRPHLEEANQRRGARVARARFASRGGRGAEMRCGKVSEAGLRRL